MGELHNAGQDQLITTNEQNHCAENQKDGIESNKVSHNNSTVCEIYHVAGNLHLIIGYSGKVNKVCHVFETQCFINTVF